mmetsp:Transcript_1260/g.4254  ORF Transcript_1260/g.4254 Transcript_1260/m.4254 type:complete len:369 (+) Transcript_1260:641-1747(+)
MLEFAGVEHAEPPQGNGRPEAPEEGGGHRSGLDVEAMVGDELDVMSAVRRVDFEVAALRKEFDVPSDSGLVDGRHVEGQPEVRDLRRREPLQFDERPIELGVEAVEVVEVVEPTEGLVQKERREARLDQHPLVERLGHQPTAELHLRQVRGDVDGGRTVILPVISVASRTSSSSLALGCSGQRRSRRLGIESAAAFRGVEELVSDEGCFRDLVEEFLKDAAAVDAGFLVARFVHEGHLDPRLQVARAHAQRLVGVLEDVGPPDRRSDAPLLESERPRAVVLVLVPRPVPFDERTEQRDALRERHGERQRREHLGDPRFTAQRDAVLALSLLLPADDDLGSCHLLVVVVVVVGSAFGGVVASIAVAAAA